MTKIAIRRREDDFFFLLFLLLRPVPSHSAGHVRAAAQSQARVCRVQVLLLLAVRVVEAAVHVV